MWNIQPIQSQPRELSICCSSKCMSPDPCILHCFCSQEPYVQAAVHFLKRRCPQLMGTPAKEDPPQLKSHQLPPDTVTAILSCLQACSR